jgi:hypothetical protein
MRRTTVLLVAMAATVALAAGAALAATVTGTDGPDILQGTMKADRIGALAGDDLYGLNGPDTYRGGDGEDSLSEYANAGGPAPPAGDGYTGKDVMYGEGGSDHLEGARGDDTLYGGPNSPDNPDPSDPTPESPEFLDGNTGDDTLKGGGPRLHGRQSGKRPVARRGGHRLPRRGQRGDGSHPGRGGLRGRHRHGRCQQRHSEELREPHQGREPLLDGHPRREGGGRCRLRVRVQLLGDKQERGGRTCRART